MDGSFAGALASLAVLILGRGSLVAGLALVLARLGRRRASGESALFGSAAVALALLPAAALLPAWELAMLDVRHDVVSPLVGGRAGLVAALWGAGALVALVRLAFDLRAASRLCRRARAVEDARLVDALARIAPAPRRVRLARSDELHAAALVGWRRPTILLPASAATWTEPELEAVLRHEVEHVRRADWLALMLDRIVGALYWPNPLVLLLRRRAALARELAADDSVLRHGVEPEPYARQLIAAARSARLPRAAVGVGFVREGVDARVRSLFDPRRDRSASHARAHLAYGLAACLAAVVIGAAQPWVCLPPRPSTTVTLAP